LNELLEFFRNVDKVYIYSILFFCCYFENIFPPLPPDTVVIISSYFVGIGFLKFNFTYLVVCLGSVFGFMTIYYVGMIFKDRIISKRSNESKFFKRMVSIENWFSKYGYKIILFNRFLSGARTLIALTAGISKMNSKKVFILALFSIILWNGILIYSGYIVGENWGILAEYLKKYNISVIIILIMVFLIYFAVRGYRKSGMKWFA